MKNCWNQELSAGDLVYRGARQGSTSEYKIGTVEYIKPGKNPRIKYLFEASGRWIRIGGLNEWISYPVKLTNSWGSPTGESLIKVDLDLEELERQHAFFAQLPRGTEFFSRQQLDASLAAWRI